MVVIIVAVSISLVATPADNGVELLAIGVQLIRRAPDIAGVSIWRIVVVFGQSHDDRGVAAISTYLLKPFNLPPSPPLPYIAFLRSRASI